MPINVPAVRFVQKGIPMYLTALPVEELDFCSIDRWDPRRTGTWKGYQRGLVQKKINNLGVYLERPDGILPVAGLLNVRKKNVLKYSGDRSSRPSHGRLIIPDETRLWVVDMQHRLEGIKLAHSEGFLQHFSVPVLITEGLSGIKEAAQFYVINTRTKRMGVDLTRRLLIEHDEIRDITDVPAWQLKAVHIAISLNKRIKNDNPWYGRIREPESERMRDHIATEKSFVPSLKWLLTATGVGGKGYSTLARFLANYWEGLRLNIPEPFEAPKSYVLQKTAGYMALHRLAPIAYRKYRRRSVADFRRLFKPLSRKRGFGSKFWHRKNLKGAKRYGTGQSAYANLAMDLAKILGL